jgi:carbon storage regulator
MLVLSRRLGEEIVIDGGIRITVVGLCGNRVRIGVTAPLAVAVDRGEVAERRRQEGWVVGQDLPAPGADCIALGSGHVL